MLFLKASSMINFSASFSKIETTILSSRNLAWFPQLGWHSTPSVSFHGERILDRRPCLRPRTSERNFHGSGGVAKSLKDLPACVVCGVRAPATEVVNANGVVHLLLRRSRRQPMPRRAAPRVIAARAIGEPGAKTRAESA